MTNLSQTEVAKIHKYASARQVMTLSLFVGMLIGALVEWRASWKLVPLAAWAAASLTYVIAIWATVWSMNAEQTKVMAVREDPSRRMTEVILVGASLASLVGVGYLLVQSSSSHGFTRGFEVGTGVISVVLSWVLVHTVNALKYARMYYGEPEGGIQFDGAKPTYADFAYLAFTLGMTFQVSDTGLQSRKIRIAVLQHTLLSYLFGTVIIATTINFLAGLSS